MNIEFNLAKEGKLSALKINRGSHVAVGQVLFTYVFDDGEKVQKFKAPFSGYVEKLHCEKGQRLKPGCLIATLSSCKHPTVVADMCAECGMDLKKLDNKNSSTASVAMIHSIPSLKISLEDAQILSKGDEERLLRQRKLVLLVDLDQTLIHTTNDNIPPNLKDVFHFQLWGHGSMWYHTRLRPGTLKFLESLSQIFELHICTFGTRSYAHVIAKNLDPKGNLFSDRILSRDECFSHNSKTANLKELFPRGDHMVCIIDDREDVWNYAPNLIHVKPYHFFRHTGDIHAPPGLSKIDDDDKSGYDFTKKSTACAQNEEKSKKVKINAKSNATEASIEEIDHVTVRIVEKEDQSCVDAPKESPPKISECVTSASMSVPLDLEMSDDEDNEDKSTERVKQDKIGTGGAVNDQPSAEVEKDLIESKFDDKNIGADNGATRKPESEANITCSSEELKAIDDKVTVDKVADDKVIDVKVTDDKFADDKVADDKVADDKVIDVKVTDDKVADDKVADDKVTGDKVTDDKVTGDKVADDKVTGDKVADDKVTDDKVADDKVTDDKIEVEDSDDYLMYLEQILKSIHKAFYSLFDDIKNQQSGEASNFIPDVKEVIPYVRKKVLKGVSIVFSGIVPTGFPLSSSRAYLIAISLGAHVSEKIIPQEKASEECPSTTHMIAARLGTAKVNEARRFKAIRIVTPNWLWCCAERWEHADERLFPLTKKSEVKRNPPPHCSSPDIFKYSLKKELITPIDDYQVPGPSSKINEEPKSEKAEFLRSINPLFTFSSDEIVSMGHEVDDICNESESSSSEEDAKQILAREKILRRKRSRSSVSSHERENMRHSLSSSSSENDDETESSCKPDLLSEDDYVPKWKKQKSSNLKMTETETEEEESLVARFRRGEPLPSDLDTLNLDNESTDDFEKDDLTDDVSDDWMAQAVEREFLADNDSSDI